MTTGQACMLNSMPPPPAMRSFLILLPLLVVVSSSHGRAQSARGAASSAPELAFTFDDLPAHGPLPPGETRMEVIAKILAALKQAKLPRTYGFLNAQWTEKEPDKIAVLRAWRDAGDPLGNHSWSHMNLNANALEAFEKDIARNEALLSELMKNEDWHWFRFPFLAEGDTPEKRNGVRAYLAKHGYKIAGVTMSFGDYLWNEPYARCKTREDQKSIHLLEDTYLRAAKDTADYSRELSHRLFHRDIPYVLLMHVGAFDAEMLPRLLEVYRKQGFQFVTLEQAERDKFYENDVNLTLPASADSLERAMTERGLPSPARPSPAPKPETVCRNGGS